MLQRLRLFVLLLALICWVPSAAVCEDEKDDPKPAPPTDQPAKPEPGSEGEEPAPPADEPAPPADEPVPPKDGPAPNGRVTNTAVAPVPVPAGMVYLEGGRVWIGTDTQYLAKVLQGRPQPVQSLFLYESPHHTVFLRPYFMGQFEVTNAQYQRFLESFRVEYDTSSGSLANLDEIAAHLTHLSKDQQKNPRQLVWRQLYFANKKAIWKAFEGKLDKLQVKRPDGTVDEERTARKFRFEPLPRTLKLEFYSLRPPDNWQDMTPPKNQRSHPVRFVSYNDAEKFAEWAGMHLPTEFEWEWAARGPGSPTFPWGEEWPPNADRANWGGKVVDSHYETSTLPVKSRWGSNPEGKAGRGVPIDKDGRSWCGCYHMVGNVAEWTQSWFEPYRLNRFRHNKMGWVKIIRGGSAADGEMIVLRPACRNFVGAGADAPPYPQNSFEWCGFRVAAYMQSGRDQLDPVVRRALKHKKIKKEHLDLERYIGSVTRNWVEPGAEPEDHVYILGRSASIILIPKKRFIHQEGMEFMKTAWKKPSRYKSSAKSLAKQTNTPHPQWILGVLHTDVQLEPVDVRRPLTPDEQAALKKRGRRGRGRAKIFPLTDGKCPPGTYLLGIWFGRLAILDLTKEFVCFVPLKEKQKSNFIVKKFKPEEVKPTSLMVDAPLDEAELFFDMPLGGKGVDERYRLAVSARLQFELGGLEVAGKWVQEHPAKELVAELWQKWLDEEKAATDGDGKNGNGKNEKPK